MEREREQRFALLCEVRFTLSVKQCQPSSSFPGFLLLLHWSSGGTAVGTRRWRTTCIYIYFHPDDYDRNHPSKKCAPKFYNLKKNKKTIRHVDCSALCPSDVNNVLIGRCWSTRMRRVPALTPDIVIVALFLVAEKCRAKFIH